MKRYATLVLASLVIASCCPAGTPEVPIDQCGDSSVSGSEECDDGNADDTDGCLNLCMVASCGDGVMRIDIGAGEEGYEECDDGNDDGLDGCANCQLQSCGDGETQPLLGEDCDDGNEVDTDGCTNRCRNAVCGDGSVFEGQEECDDGNEVDTDACTNNCLHAVCGDGSTFPNYEDCDDGNEVDTDACTNACLNAVCGDGIQRIDLAEGDVGYEACDDGNLDDTDDCLSTCQVAVCGDGAVWNGHEYCDDGNTNEDDDCDSTCYPTMSPLTGGYGHMCILRGGISYCTGSYIGNGENARSDMMAKRPTNGSRLTDVLQASSAGNVLCSLKTDGTVWCWGAGRFGGLGNGSLDDLWSPTQVSGLTDVVEMASGFAHHCARKSDGTVWCWGRNNEGQCGDPNRSEDTSRPLQIAGLTNATALTAGIGHSCARRADGTYLCWGYRNALGTGAGELIDTPVPGRSIVINDPEIVELRAGGGGTCARKSDGTLWCWGGNSFGGLGNGSLDPDGVRQSDDPVQVSIIDDAIRLASTGYLTWCTLRSDRTVWCWGSNQRGALGNGEDSAAGGSNGQVPTPVTGLSNVRYLLNGNGQHGNMAMTMDGKVYAWGGNYYGHLGLGESGTQVYLEIQLLPEW